MNISFRNSGPSLLPSLHYRRVHFDPTLRIEHRPSPGVAPLVILEDLNGLDNGVQSSTAADLMYRVVQMNFTPEIEVLYMRFERFLSIFSMTSLEHAPVEYFNSGVKSNWTPM